MALGNLLLLLLWGSSSGIGQPGRDSCKQRPGGCSGRKKLPPSTSVSLGDGTDGKRLKPDAAGARLSIPSQ